MATKKGNDDNNVLTGTAGDDTIFGYGGDDKITGGKGNDTLSGGTGKDLFVIDSRTWGNDTITDWGAGDRIDVSALNITSFAVLQKLFRTGNFGVGFAVRTNGQASSIFLENTDVTSLKASDFLFSKSKVAMTIKGTAGDDSLFGANGNDIIMSSAGADILAGGGGKDTFVFDKLGFGYDEILDFGKGDRLDLSALHVSDFDAIKVLARNAGGGVTMGFSSGGLDGSVVLTGRTVASLSAKDFIFDLSGKPIHSDGSATVDLLFGGTGDDTLKGGGEYDTLFGGAGDDILDAGADGGALYLGKGNDQVVLSQRFFGTDVIHDFGAGDKVDVSALGIGDFSAIKPFLTQASPTETLLFLGVGAAVYFEGVKLATIGADDFIFERGGKARTLDGSAFDDFLIGGSAGDRLNGGTGSDVLSGGAGHDTLVGGGGADRLYGGDGGDIFAYTDVGDSASNTGGGFDHIVDFSRSEGDRIDLSAIDAIAGSAPNDAFKFIGTRAFSGAAGEVRYEVSGGSAHVYATVHDSGGTFAVLEFIIDGATDLKVGDFIL